MDKIRTAATAILSVDTRSLEFGISLMNFVWGWWLLLVNTELTNETGDLVIIRLSSYGGMLVWGLVFMALFATGFVFAYRSIIEHEVVFWRIRFYVMVLTAIFWFSFTLLFVHIAGFFSVPAFVFAAVGLMALFGSILLRWDYLR